MNSENAWYNMLLNCINKSFVHPKPSVKTASELGHLTQITGDSAFRLVIRKKRPWFDSTDAHHHNLKSKNMTNEKLKYYLDNRLDKIEQMLQGIIQILEANIDSQQDAQEIMQRPKKSQETIRQLNYEKWLLENQDKVSTTINPNKKS